MSYVIIGGSAAGISAAKAVRQREPGSKVAIVSEEPGLPYYRPMIPMLISGERTGAEITWPDDLEKDMGVQFVRSRAVRVDTEGRLVKLSDGGTLTYRRLLIATGARAKGISVPGMAGDGVFTLRTADDAQRIREAIPNAKSAVVVGGGFVGVKAAEALNKAGVSVTILEAMPDILRPRLDSRGAAIISTALEAKGIRVRTNDTAAEVARDKGAVKGVATASGETIPADFIVVAVGTTPNVEFLADSGVSADTGVTVGDTLETNVPGVFAAGDAARHVDVITGKPALCALWSNAAEMGRLAGCNMAGDKLKYPGMLSVKNAAEVAGVPVISVGEVMDGQFEAVSAADTRLYRKLAFEDDVVVGAVFMGELRGAGLYTSLIRNRIPLKGLKAKAIDDRLTYADFMRLRP